MYDTYLICLSLYLFAHHITYIFKAQCGPPHPGDGEGSIWYPPCGVGVVCGSVQSVQSV